MFASPVRKPSGAWIWGPGDVAQQLDWLRCIVNLHTQMALQARHCCQYQTEGLGLVYISNLFFFQLAPRLQLYQPCLVHFPAVSAAINTMVAN
ncbi:hypothetical protein VP01_448g7 [Puccinia sorghi]|uniref:Uncharacterized protein n=1 Tax=Puccinia sorghi TaxID=27349 RepID=A0A0L6UP74_9BASI|nr:hypothetical protein VP01_448g7 [Puccinia sorghi]